MRFLFGLLLYTSYIFPVNAESIATLMEMARSTEPAYLSAKAAVSVAEAKEDQAFGAMLPQVSASLNTKYSDRDYQNRSTNSTSQITQYNSHSQQVNLTQPILKLSNYYELNQAKAVVAQSRVQLASAEQELLTKVTSAWLELLATRDNKLYAKQQSALLGLQDKVAQRGSKLGLVSRPAANEAKAKYEQAKADVFVAETEFLTKQAALEQVVGSVNELKLSRIEHPVVIKELESMQLSDLVSEVESTNPGIQAARQAYQAAKKEIDKQWAGHLPTLDLVASYGKDSQGQGGFPGQPGWDITTSTIGLQLNVPIYSGGTQSAKVKEAIAQAQKAELDIESAKRSSILAIKQAWYSWQAAYAKADASKHAIESAQLAITEAEKAKQNELKTEVEVLQAKLQLVTAQRDYWKASYDELLGFVKIKALTGRLAIQDIAEMDGLFVVDADKVRRIEESLLLIAAK